MRAWTWNISSGPITVDPTSFVATGSGVDPLGNVVTFPGDEDEQDDVSVEVAGEQGCTPGFWKPQPNFDPPHCWCEEYDPGDRVDSVFTIPTELSNLADDTLEDALRYKGGKGVEGAARNLLRQAVAALLNACHDNVAYPMGEAQVISEVNEALATLDRGEILGLKNLLDE